ncbi:hypothetical protein [Mesorhizobium sp.]|uniref:hypothetical protein n=1 Tax=Mesorhizobium sp. TaxID=1871066 RepID=UPI000FEA9366|nr:hypothetical protein [Mesorhizobium sp.]RWE37444.1 MAG: hypothetical protein EOS77_02370 [Mesorhizobium sp.]
MIDLCMTRQVTVHNVFIVEDPVFRVREPFTGDQEQMLADMRHVEPLRRDNYERARDRLHAYAARSIRQSIDRNFLRAIRGHV